MIDATGTITALDKEYAIVRMDEAGCGRCHDDGGCGGNNLGKMLCSTPQTFRVLNPENAVVGQRVNVMIPDGAVRHSALMVYGFPLFALFAGAFAGSAIAGETGAMAGFGVSLAFSWLALWRAQTGSARDPRFQPSIRT